MNFLTFFHHFIFAHETTPSTTSQHFNQHLDGLKFDCTYTKKYDCYDYLGWYSFFRNQKKNYLSYKPKCGF